MATTLHKLKFKVMKYLKQEVTGRINRLLSVDTTRNTNKNDAINNSSIVACIRCRGNVFTEPLPSSDREIFTKPLPSKGRDTHIH
jgi:hypothetical protein